jgi:hypothetical protein
VHHNIPPFDHVPNGSVGNYDRDNNIKNVQLLCAVNPSGKNNLKHKPSQFNI